MDAGAELIKMAGCQSAESALIIGGIDANAHFCGKNDQF
jgi:hypothetical protein